MTQVSVPQGVLYPGWNWITYGASFLAGANVAIDATGEKLASVGRCYIDGRAASKTIDTSGSSSIQFRLSSAAVWANGSTSITIGIQDVDAAAGPAGRPDGTFDVSKTFAGGTTVTANTWNTIVPDTGTKTISNGDLIAVVFDMTTRAGADVFSIVHGGGQTNGEPFDINDTGGGYGNASSGVPNVVIVFSDGTLGTIEFTMPFSASATESYSNSTNPDERGMIFQVPWDCKIDALFMHSANADANADGTLTLYSTPTGTPSSIASVSVPAEQRGGSTSDRPRVFSLASEVTLSKNTDYCLAYKADGTSNVTLHYLQVGNTAHRALYSGGTTLKKATRDGGSGAFSPEGTPTILYGMGVRISSLDDGTGTGSGGGVHYTNHMRGNLG